MDKTVFTFRKGSTEEVRASVLTFKGRVYIDLRAWVEKDTGHLEFSPTKKGIRLDAYTFPEFKRAVLALEDELRQRGLLESNNVKE